MKAKTNNNIRLYRLSMSTKQTSYIALSSSKIHTPDKNPTLCTIQIVDEDLTAGTHKRRRKCPTSTFVLDKEGIVDSETYKVPQNEADCK